MSGFVGRISKSAIFAAVIYVTRAIVIQEHAVLTAQRPASMSLPFKWELPGGKMEPGEAPEECVIRETLEELGLDVAVLKSLPYVDREFRGKHYRMLPYICEVTGGTLEVFEHEQAGWWPLHRLMELDWAPAEKMVMEQYMKLYPAPKMERIQPRMLSMELAC